jgi:hypothetical protein
MGNEHGQYKEGGIACADHYLFLIGARAVVHVLHEHPGIVNKIVNKTMNSNNPRGVKKGTKIEMLGNCKVCGNVIREARFRTYCSPKCRRKSYNEKRYVYNLKWQREKREKMASVPAEGKTKCWICGNWYGQVGSHVHQRHGIRAREYREKYGIEVKKRNRKKVDGPDLTPPADRIKL